MLKSIKQSNNGYLSAVTLYIIVAIVSIVAIIFLGWYVFYSQPNKSTSKPTTTSLSANNSTTKSNNAGSSSSNPSTDNATNSSVNTNGQDMPNTGPGNVAFIFMAVSVAATMGKYIQLRKKLSQS